MTTFRRVHARFPCDLPVDIFSPVTESKLSAARIINIGMGGAAVESVMRLQKGVPYELRFTWLKDKLRVVGRVAWSSPADPKKNKAPSYGVSFNLSTKQEAVMKALIDRLRKDHWPAQKERITDYWSI